MSERTFLIGEYGKGEWYITESELKTRCEIVASILSGHSPGVRGWNEARDVLIYGEKDSSPA